jgi:hypothetical protein
MLFLSSKILDVQYFIFNVSGIFLTVYISCDAIFITLYL